MGMKTGYIIVSAALILAVAAEESIKDCFNQDSISCIQMSMFRKAREFFDNPEINIIDGLTLVKGSDRSSRSMSVDSTAVEQAKSVDDRENALENYVSERAMRFFEERSLNMDVMAVGRAVATAVPEDVKESVRAMVGEARKKKKKLLKKLGPLLNILKLKMTGLLLIGLLIVGAIAKKALLIATIALILSKLLLIKKVIGGLVGGLGAAGLGAGLGSKLGGGGGGITEILGGLGGLGGGGGGGSDAGSIAYGGYAPQSHY